MKRLISFVSNVIRAEREEWLLALIEGLPGWPTSWESRANPQSPGVRNLPSRRTGCVAGNEQCVSLSGKLFDEQGEPLYATGAKGRHGGRYRYYVSRRLVRGGCSSVSEEKGWRLAAPELEQTVIVSARSILKDQRVIATTLQEAGLSSAEIDSVLKAADAKSALLESGP